MKVLIRGPSQAIEVEGIFWYIVAALFFFSDYLNGSILCSHVENIPMVLCWYQYWVISDYFQVTYAFVLSQFISCWLMSVFCLYAYSPFSLPAINKWWVDLIYTFINDLCIVKNELVRKKILRQNINNSRQRYVSWDCLEETSKKKKKNGFRVEWKQSMNLTW